MPEPAFLQLKPKESEPPPGDPDEVLTDFDKLLETGRDANVDPERQIQRILDCVLPPRRIRERGQFFIQRASPAPTTRLDLVALQEKFEASLLTGRAKPFGICPVRRRIYDELFDELIRQVTVNCAERGLLLLRVRDEMRLTLLAYQSVLESAIAYGVRKAVSVETQQTSAVLERDQERVRNGELTAKVEQLQQQLATERSMQESQSRLIEQAMRDENERLLESNRVLKMHLQSIIQMDQQSQLRTDVSST